MNFMDSLTNAVCGGADVLRVIKFVWILLDLVFWIVPMGLIVMISVDFAKNVMAGKEDEMRKNVGIVVKRIIFCVALFLIMPIVEFVIGMFADETDVDWVYNGEKVNWATCITIATTEDDFSAYEIIWDESDIATILESKKEFTVPVGVKIRLTFAGFDCTLSEGDVLKYNSDTGKYHILNNDGSFGAFNWSLDEIKAASVE